MNGTFFYIGLGLGLGVAAGLRPFLPALLAGALGSAGALGVGFAHGHGDHYRFLQSGGWLLAVTVALVGTYLLQFRFSAERLESGAFAATLTGIGIGVGALLFAGTLAAHGDLSWPGLLAGAAAAAFGQAVSRPLLARTRTRLPDRAARDALTLYLDSAALLLAALVALLHPLGYVALALFALLAVRTRAREGEKYAGLRILRR